MSIINSDPIFLEKDSKSVPQSEHSRNNSKADNNTLGSLTKKFVELIKTSPNQTIEIQQASQKLGIQKRRIYDITNVLEGIGYIEKIAKNSMKWVGGVEGCELQKELKELQQKRQELQKNCQKVEDEIQYFNAMLQYESLANCQFNYLLREDLNTIMEINNLKNFLLYTGAVKDQTSFDFYPQAPVFIIQTFKKQTSMYCCYKNDGPSILQSQQFDQPRHKQVQRPKKMAEKKQKQIQIQGIEEKFAYEKEQIGNCSNRKVKFSPADVIINGSIYDLDDSPLFQQDLFRVSE